MSRLVRLIGLFVVMLLTATPATTQASYTPTARETVLTYYHHLNRRDFAAAYALLRNPTQNLTSYAAGFADLQRAVPFIGAAQVAGSYTRVPVVLVVYRNDASIASFYGCFTVRDNAITRTRMRVVAGAGYPDAAAVSGYLAINCATLAHGVTAPTFRDLSVSRPAHDFLLAYFDDINQARYAGAYSRWLAPQPTVDPDGYPARDYRPAYGAFVQGYADTRYIDVYVGDYVYTGAAAGKPYLDGLLPVVLIGENTDGSARAFSGCYVIGRFPESGSYAIVSGRLRALGTGLVDGAAIVNALTLDCTTLDLNT
jgi:hypothetical protein